MLVLLDGVTVPGCPFSCNVYDVNKVNVSGLNSCAVGKPMTFQGMSTIELHQTIDNRSSISLYTSGCLSGRRGHSGAGGHYSQVFCQGRSAYEKQRFI